MDDPACGVKNAALARNAVVNHVFIFFSKGTINFLFNFAVHLIKELDRRRELPRFNYKENRDYKSINCFEASQLHYVDEE